MTVPTEVSRSTYAGNGVTTVFSTGFYFLVAGDLKVKLTPAGGGTETVQILGVDYTVTLPAAVGAAGSITMTVAPPAGSSLVIERDVLFVQNTSFRTQGQFSPAVHEDAMDRIVFEVQELARRVGDLESAGAPGAVVAGNGLFFSGDTLHVGAGPGVQSNPNDIAVLYGSTVEMEPVISDSGAADAGGGFEKAAPIDHTHVASTAAPAAGSVAVGNAAGLGLASTLSRSDHVHPVTAPAAPANVTKAAASAGASANFAREDHKHDATTAAPVPISDDPAPVEGTSTSLARADHVHPHGDRGGGTLHSGASASVSGFMSAADKVKLDGLALETVSVGTVQSTDATPKQVLIYTPVNQTAEEVDLTVIGRKSGAADAGGYRRKFTVTRYDGTTSLVGTVDTLGADKETNAAWDVSVSISSPQVIVTVTGVAATTIDWRAVARRVVAP